MTARDARCISTAQLSASTTLEKSASTLSPAVPTIRPPCAAISGSTARAELAESLMRAGLILAHQPAEPDHIRMQDGGEFSLPGGRFPRRTRRVIEQGAHRGCV